MAKQRSEFEEILRVSSFFSIIFCVYNAWDIRFVLVLFLLLLVLVLLLLLLVLRMAFKLSITLHSNVGDRRNIRELDPFYLSVGSKINMTHR